MTYIILKFKQNLFSKVIWSRTFNTMILTNMPDRIQIQEVRKVVVEVVSHLDHMTVLVSEVL